MDKLARLVLCLLPISLLCQSSYAQPTRKIKEYQAQSHQKQEQEDEIQFFIPGHADFSAMSLSDQKKLVRDLRDLSSEFEKQKIWPEGHQSTYLRFIEILNLSLIPEARANAGCTRTFTSKTSANNDGQQAICITSDVHEFCPEKKEKKNSTTCTVSQTVKKVCNDTTSGKIQITKIINETPSCAESYRKVAMEVEANQKKAALMAQPPSNNQKQAPPQTPQQIRDQDVDKRVSETNQDDKGKLKNDFECIYAGNIIKKSNKKDTKRKCPTPREATIIENNKEVIVKCPSSSDEALKGLVVVCEPHAYGRRSDKRPICVGKSDSASELCDEESEKTVGALEDAVSLLSQNEKKYREIKETLEFICKKPQELGKDSKSTTDIIKTCEIYQARFDLYESKRDGTCRRGCGGGYTPGTK